MSDSDDDEYNPGEVAAPSAAAPATSDPAIKQPIDTRQLLPAKFGGDADVATQPPPLNLGASSRPEQHPCTLPGMRGISMKPHSKAVTALALSPSGSVLCSGGKDGQLCMWDFAGLTANFSSNHHGDGADASPSLALRPTRTLTPFPHRSVADTFLAVTGISWSSSGAYFIACEDGERPVLIKSNGAMGARCMRGQHNFVDPVKAVGHCATVMSTHCSPNTESRFVSAGGQDLTVRCWDVARMEETSVFAVVHGASASSRDAATAADDDGAFNEVLCARYIPASCGRGATAFMSVGTDRLAQVWDERVPFRAGKPQQQVKLAAHAGDIAFVSSTSAAPIVSFRCADETVCFYDLRKFTDSIIKPIGPFTYYGDTMQLASLTFGSSASVALVTSAKGLSAVGTGGHLIVAADPLGMRPGFFATKLSDANHGSAVCASPDGSVLVGGSSDGTVHCYWRSGGGDVSTSTGIATWVGAWEAARASRRDGGGLEQKRARYEKQ